MNQKQISTVRKHLTIKNGRVTTTSLDVANFFNKKHKHVLEAVMNLECPPDFNRPNFRPVEYKDAKGEMRPMLEITRKGFVLLAMGFTGPRAMEFKIAYIEAFDQMERALIQGAGNRGALEPAALRAELLKARPLWAGIKRYMDMGLSRAEIVLLVRLHKDTVRKHVRRMEKCGLLEPPADLARLQRAALRLLPFNREVVS